MAPGWANAGWRVSIGTGWDFWEEGQCVCVGVKGTMGFLLQACVGGEDGKRHVINQPNID